MTTRRNILKGGAGLAAILASGKAPAYIIKSMLAARNCIGMRVGGAKLPYDAEVEYLESTGTQYIDTGVYGNLNTVAELRACATAMDALHPLFGSRSGYRSNAFAVYNGSDVGYKYVVSFDNVYNRGYVVSTVSASTNDWVDFSISKTPKIGEWSSDIGHLNPTSFTTPGTLCIFAWNQTGTITKGKYKVSYCKIYQNGVLVRDFQPVRFTNELGQSEGAMYDRVSGELEPFRNQGTGAFLYGGDVYSVPVETSQYVQDGLVAMWDGKENAGVGKHSPNTMSWKDLSPSGFDMTNQQGAFDIQFYWKDDCIYCNDVSGSRFFGVIGGVPQALVDAVNSGDVTIQGVVRHMRDANAGVLVSQLYEGGSANNLNIQCPVAGGSAAIRMEWKKFSPTYGLSYGDAPLLAVSPSFLSIVKKSDTTMESLCVVNGTTFTATGNSGSYNAMTTTGRFALMGMGASAFWSGRHTIGELYAIRIYNRALTAAEIAANYAVDKARFNLP